MERYSEVVGLPVICVENGKSIGTVKDIIFCPAGMEVKALIIEPKGGRIFKKAILLEDVLELGKDAVIIGSKCEKDIKQLEEAGKLNAKGPLIGLKIYSKSGEDLGVVNDVLFSAANGTIEGVEMSEGLLQDIVQGRKILPLFGKVEFGSENMLVSKEAVEEIINSEKGLRNILNSK